MRIAHLLTLAAAAAVSFSASAEPATSASASTPTVNVNAPVTARPVYQMNRAEYQRLQGAYHLDDGRVLNVSTEHGKLFADLDGKRSEIVPTGPNRFASRDDSVRVRFDQLLSTGEVAVSVPRG